LNKQWIEHENLLEKYQFRIDKLESLYFGGGTPSLWGSSGADYFLENFLKHKISLDSDCEFTMEIDPQSWSENALDRWIDLGVNRLSIGTQSFNPKFIEIMDRGHGFNEVLDLLDYAAHSNQKFTVDFMLGLPYSQDYNRDIIEELKQILEYNPTHLSLYILATRKNYPHNHKLPDDDYTADEYLKVADYLQSQGFDHYEVSNFSKDDHFSKHNLKYWKYESVAALGPNATGLIMDGEQAIRYQWKSGSIGFQETPLSADELKLEQVYLALRTNRGLNPKVVGIDLSSVVNKWNEQGYLVSDDPVRLNSKGFLVLDSLMDDIFNSNIL
jgi:oxygen-independent coproporphyrinogen-3 oxidase